MNFDIFEFKLDIVNKQLNIGLDLDYDKEKQEETEFQKRLKVYKLKYAKRFKIIKYSFNYNTILKCFNF